MTEKPSEARREKDVVEAALAERISAGEAYLAESRATRRARLQSEIADLKARLAGMAHLQAMRPTRRGRV